MKKFFLCVLILVFLPAYSEVVKVEIAPNRVSSKIKQIHGPYLALNDSGITSNGFLLISIAGTSSKPSDFSVVHIEALKLGFHVLAIDYPNDVISTTCRDSKDLMCFDTFRKEIVTGETVSPLVNVDRANSLINRIETLIKYMSAHSDPANGWDQFVNAFGMINWKKIVVVGHSQGSGHAAYLGKIRPLHAVLMAAGPQDSFTDKKLAPWIEKRGETPPSNYYSLLHYQDFFGVDYQIEADLALTNQADIASIENEAPSNGARILVSNLPVSDAHMSVITSQFQNVWKYLLSLSE